MWLEVERRCASGRVVAGSFRNVFRTSCLGSRLRSHTAQACTKHWLTSIDATLMAPLQGHGCRESQREISGVVSPRIGETRSSAGRRLVGCRRQPRPRSVRFSKGLPDLHDELKTELPCTMSKWPTAWMLWVNSLSQAARTGVDSDVEYYSTGNKFERFRGVFGIN